MKFVSLFFTALSLFLLSGCHGNREPEIVLSQVANTSPENIQFVFSSVEPQLLARTGSIYLNQFGGELTIKCANTPSIYLGYMSDPDKYFVTCPVEGYTRPDSVVSQRGNWSVSVIDNNLLRFKIEAIDTDTLSSYDYEVNDCLPICSMVKGKVVNTNISIKRVLDKRFIDIPKPDEKEINSEADIEYFDRCPFDKYDISHMFRVMSDGKILTRPGSTQGMPYDACRIYLECVLDKADPDFTVFNSVPYMAIYSYVISPFSDKPRLVRNDSNGPLFKNIVPEDEFRYIIDEMEAGDELNYTLILANIDKKGLQKLEFKVQRL